MKRKAIIVAALALALCASANAFINPAFTPMDLVEQSDVILLLELGKVDDKDVAGATVKKVLQGEFEKKQISFNLSASAFPDQITMVKDWIAAGHAQALLFTGRFQGDGDGQIGGDEALGYLNFNGKWIVLNVVDETRWDLDQRNEYILGTWAGGTDMLLRAVNYILSDPAADVPVDEGVMWDEQVSGGQVAGKVVAAQAVDLDGKGKAWLFLASPERDRLFLFDGQGLKDVTDAHKLASKSVAFAWGDFNGDGKLDLASHDGAELTVHYQDGQGTFACKPAGVLKEGCLSLSVLDVGSEGRAGLVAGTKTQPLLVVFSRDGGARTEPLPTGEAPIDQLGEGGGCLVADFDGDAIPDVLQLFTPAGLFYKGEAPGKFKTAVLTGASKSRGRYDACLGDFDADGLPDLFVCAEDGNQVWQNEGKGRFSPMLYRSGEIEYIPKPGGVAAQVGDFNNDGRQDVFMAYWTEKMPQLFFNRGFRSFGHARMVDLNEQGLLDEAVNGQQAGCLGDFNGDGALDMVLVLANGELWMFPRLVDEDAALAVVIALPPGTPHAGPVNVSAWRDERPLGAWVVRAGEPGALIGFEDAGAATIKWRWPGGEVIEKEIGVEGGPVRVLLDEK